MTARCGKLEKGLLTKTALENKQDKSHFGPGTGWERVDEILKSFRNVTDHFLTSGAGLQRTGRCLLSSLVDVLVLSMPSPTPAPRVHCSNPARAAVVLLHATSCSWARDGPGANKKKGAVRKTKLIFAVGRKISVLLKYNHLLMLTSMVRNVWGSENL